jgi:hypothetical protein
MQKSAGVVTERKNRNNKKTALEEWQTHNPFQRATSDLIRRVERELKELQRSKQEPAPF